MIKIINSEEFSTYYSKFTEFDEFELNKLKELLLQTENYEKIEFNIIDNANIIFHLYPVSNRALF